MGKTIVDGKITYHRMDVNSYIILNKNRTVDHLKSIKSGGQGARYQRLTMFGEALPEYPPTSLLTKKQIKANKKGGPYSEGRSKKKSYIKQRFIHKRRVDLTDKKLGDRLMTQPTEGDI